MNMEKRHSFCMYCDDIRHEVDNKVSLMGIYGPNILCSQFPFVIPKLCIVAVFRSPVAEPIQRAFITITLDQQVLTQVHIPEEQIQLANKGGGLVATEQYPMRLISLGATYVFAQLPIEKSGVITATFTVDDVDYIAGRIMLSEI